MKNLLKLKIFDAGSTPGNPIPGFDILKTSDLHKATWNSQTPFRDFYQISMLNNLNHTQLVLNGSPLNLPPYSILATVPENVISWINTGKIFGYFVQFNSEFAGDFSANLPLDFSFFKKAENRVYLMTKNEHEALVYDLQRMHSVAQSPHPFQEKVLSGMLQNLLYFCKTSIENQNMAYYEKSTI